MKKRYLFVMAALALLTITGCKENKSKTETLSAPQQIIVQSDGDKSLIIFNEVPNAKYYDICINDVCVTVRATGTGTVQFDASKIITLPQKYNIKIKALSDKHFDSEFTEIYEYNHTTVIDAPILTIDGTTLNWDKVANAEFYDVVVTSTNLLGENRYRCSINKFDFKNVITGNGEYIFKVKAINDSGDYLSSGYSNQVKYEHITTLETPSNLKVAFDETLKETLLSFVANPNIKNFTININGINYSFGESEITNFSISNENYQNLYTIRLSEFATYKGLSMDSFSKMSIKVKSNTSSMYLRSSEFSDIIECQFIKVLEPPRFEMKTTGSACKIKISSNSSPYLAGYAIYLNDLKYKTLTDGILEIDIPLTVVGNAGIRIQAISNNVNCYSSNLSEPKYVDTAISALSSTSITYNNNVISWTSVKNATKYYVEVFNSTFRYEEITDETSLDIASICKFDKYSVRVTAIADGYKQSQQKLDFNHTAILQVPQNVYITTVNNSKYLNFDTVENAHGYLMYINDKMVKQLFVSSPINISSYINDANSYKFEIKAVDVLNTCIFNSEKSESEVIESIKTLSAPVISISKNYNSYYLNVIVDETQAGMSTGYEIWINYQSIGTFEFKNMQMNLSDYLVNAGEYHFMIKAKAISSDYINDSNFASASITFKKQLNEVTDINVAKLTDENRYMLTFKEQTLAAKYLVTIKKADDDNFKVEIDDVLQGFVDITDYVKENGVYRIYVRAIALEESAYIDSVECGNPYRLVKATTLEMVTNIQKEKKDNGEINITWNKVENASGYQVYVYYNQGDEQFLRKSTFVAQSENPIVNIGSGKDMCVNKEGDYLVQIRAIGDGTEYESGQSVIEQYKHTMELVADFERNSVFMYGANYSYKIEDVEDLKNLLWYHYLYNSQTWKKDTLNYNLKIYCDKDLDDLANSISATIGNEVTSVSTNAEKMDIIAKVLLAQYPEISSISYGIKEDDGTAHEFCNNEEENVYIFGYQDSLDNFKTETIETERLLYDDYVEMVGTFDQRSPNYVFAIDKKDGIDVSTTEQLFMALQYNKKPVFVGDCELAKIVYENAKFILRNICTDSMSDYDKVLQIYNFLTKRVTWSENSGAFDESVELASGMSTMRANLKDFYLEGLLYNNQADSGLYTSINEFNGLISESIGLAKVFVALCSIEGIDSIKVDGDNNYSWNKVYIDIEDGIEGKCWYAIDLVGAIKNQIAIKKSGIPTNYQISTHIYFLTADANIDVNAKRLHKRFGGHDEEYKAEKSFDYYQNTRFSCIYNNTEIVVNKTLKLVNDGDNLANEDEMIDILTYVIFEANKHQGVVIDMDALDYINNITGGSTDENVLAGIITNITGTSGIYKKAQEALSSSGVPYNLSSLTIKIIDARYIVFVAEA